MTTTDWITDIALVLVVFRQLREGRLGLKSYLLPLGIVAFVASRYLHTVPTAGNDLVLIGALVAAGAALGVAGGVHTRIRSADGHLLIKAGAVSAVLWVLGMGARMGFQIWTDHGGADDVARFSVNHDITTVLRPGRRPRPHPVPDRGLDHARYRRVGRDRQVPGRLRRRR